MKTRSLMLRLSFVTAVFFGGVAVAAAQEQKPPVVPEASGDSIPPPKPGTDATQNHPVPPTGPVRMGQGVVAGSLMTKVSPRYPAEAKAKGIEGTVVLHAIIGKDGHIKDLTPIDGPDVLVQAAMDAVQQWVYRPYMLNGFPAEVDTRIVINFNLNHTPPKGS